LLRVTFDFEENERRMQRFCGQKADEIMRAMGPTHLVPNAPLAPQFDVTKYQTTHVVGGAIMGDDPRTTVVDDSLQMWDVTNVFVIGASAFPQNAGLNPTGTVGALAYRAAHAIRTGYLPSHGPLRAS
jgi:gluconate 2-dehydrogenase alpha chain